MAAMIRPVRINHADFGNGRIALLRNKILLTEGNVVCIHSKTILRNKSLQTRTVQRTETVEHSNRRRHIIRSSQRFHGLQRCFAAFNRVDDIFFHSLDIRIRQIAVEQVNACGAHERTLALRDDLDALRRRIGALVKLSGQIFHRKHTCAVCVQRVCHNIKLRLGKHGFRRVSEKLRVDVFHVIAIQKAQIAQAIDSEKVPDIGCKSRRLVCQRLFLFHKNSVYHESLL